MSRPHSGGHGVPFDPMALLAGAQRRRQTPETFWAKVDRSAGANGCWLWTRRSSPEGYGLLTWCGVDVQAHRLAYALTHGPLLALTVVRHTCDNPPCCNPAHLIPGTIAQNNADARERGRAAVGHLPVLVGVANHNAKLTDARVRELRAAWRAGESIKSIVERTGLAVGTVHPMLHGKTWRHVADDVAEAAE